MKYIDLSLIDPNEIRSWIERGQEILRWTASQTDTERKEYIGQHPIWGDLKNVFIAKYGKKCWYSECYLDSQFGHVDHFRPKSRSVDMEGNILLPEGYWWLAYDYRNYRLSAETCNVKKGCKFPLFPGSAPAAPGESNDRNMLLDPCCQADTELITCDETGEIYPRSSDSYDRDRVRISVEVYGLNDFNEKRKMYLSHFRQALKDFDKDYFIASDSELKYRLQDLVLYLSPKAEFSTLLARYLKEMIWGKPYEECLLRYLKNAGISA